MLLRAVEAMVTSELEPPCYHNFIGDVNWPGRIPPSRLIRDESGEGAVDI